MSSVFGDSLEEIIAGTGESKEHILEIVNMAANDVASLEAELSSPSSRGILTLEYYLDDPNALAEMEAVTDTDDTIHKLLDRIDPRLRLVLELRYGLNTYHPHSLGEAAEVMELTRERVRQLEKKAVEAIQNIVEEEQLHNAL